MLTNAELAESDNYKQLLPWKCVEAKTLGHLLPSSWKYSIIDPNIAAPSNICEFSRKKFLRV